MKMWLVLLTTLVSYSSATEEIRIPLTYAFNINKTTKLPIELSFNHSFVYSTSPTPDLYLLNYSLAVPVRNFAIVPNRSIV